MSKNISLHLVGEGVRATVADGDPEHEHHHLGEELEDVCEGQVADPAVRGSDLDAVELVQPRVEALEHVAVGDHHTLRSSRGACTVRVTTFTYNFLYCTIHSQFSFTLREPIDKISFHNFLIWFN